MADDYQILAGIHAEIHMGDFARSMTGRLIDYAQRNDWMGRKITDIGCGTGETLKWLAQHGYIVTGVDKSSEMLKIAKASLDEQGINANLTEADFRAVDTIVDQDMLIALNMLNELRSIRELEQAFKHIQGMLKQGRLFVFDIYTIEGLVERNQNGYTLEQDEDGLTIFVKNNFNYEKSIQERHYTIFRQQSSGWQRHEATRQLRAYPTQAVIGLVKRAGFDVKHVLNMNMVEYTPSDRTPRIIVFAEKS